MLRISTILRRQVPQKNCFCSFKILIVFCFRFYIFVCSVCNHGKEYVQRLHIKLDDIIQLIFFNLAILHSREFFTLDEIFLYALNNWKALNLPSSVRIFLSKIKIYTKKINCAPFFQLQKLTHSDVTNQILKTVSTRKITFKCREIKKTTEYGLRCQQAPFVPNIVLQQGPPVTERYVKIFCYENYRLHVIPKRFVCDLWNKSKI